MTDIANMLAKWSELQKAMLTTSFVTTTSGIDGFTEQVAAKFNTDGNLQFDESIVGSMGKEEAMRLANWIIQCHKEKS